MSFVPAANFHCDFSIQKKVSLRNPRSGSPVAARACGCGGLKSYDDPSWVKSNAKFLAEYPLPRRKVSK